MRDHADNAVVVCSIENVDPMGVHTGDSVTVAPQQTLTDREYQAMRDDALACLRAIGVETGGSNVQFAVEPGHRAPGADRDEPPREPFVRARLEGDRVPDREDRRDARRRVPIGRDPQRHHGRDARFVRAHARLRRGQDPAVRLREVPRRRRGAHVDDEVRRRGDGDRTDVPGGVREGMARAREGGRGPGGGVRPTGGRRARRPPRRHRGALPSDRAGVRRGSQRGRGRRGVRDRSLVRRPVRAGVRARRRDSTGCRSRRSTREPSGAPSAPVCRTRGSRGPPDRPSARSASGGRRSTSSRSSSPSTPAAASSPLGRRTTTPPTTRRRRWSPRRGRAS